jgi:hypothetical protein
LTIDKTKQKRLGNDEILLEYSGHISRWAGPGGQSVTLKHKEIRNVKAQGGGPGWMDDRCMV